MNNNQNASKRLVKNTIIYMIGNMGSKVLQMLILPLITAVLLTEEYGYYDLVITTISLVTPIVTLQILEAVFRFLFEGDDEQKKTTVSTAVSFLIIGFAILAIIVFIVSFVTDSIQYPFLIYLNYISCIMFEFMQKLARCEQKNSQVAISGVVNTFVMLGTQAVTLLFFNMRTDGMLLANCISYFVAAAYLAPILHVEKRLSYRSIDRTHLKELLKYSIPLVPNSICWWFVAACDKYVISIFLSVAANGVYSIAGKFPQLMSLVTTVFQKAWQESSIIEANSESRNQFYTNTFNAYMKLLLSGYIVLLPLVRVAMPYLVSESYQIGYLYNPLLLLGSVFSAFSQFYGSAYLTFKKTNGAFFTTIVAAVINCLCAIILIRYIGLFGPAIGTTAAFFVQWLLRMHQMRDYFKVTIDKKALVLLSVVGTVTTGLYYLNSVISQIIVFAIGCVFFVIMNKKLLNPFVTKIWKK